MRRLCRAEDLDRLDELVFRREEQRLVNSRLNAQLLDRVRRLDDVWSAEPNDRRRPPGDPLEPTDYLRTALDGRRWSDSLPCAQVGQQSFSMHRISMVLC